MENFKLKIGSSEFEIDESTFNYIKDDYVVPKDKAINTNFAEFENKVNTLLNNNTNERFITIKNKKRFKCYKICGFNGVEMEAKTDTSFGFDLKLDYVLILDIVVIKRKRKRTKKKFCLIKKCYKF